jgi:hypothetical protein
VLDRGDARWRRERDKKQVKARQARLAKNNAQSTPALQLQEGEMGYVARGSSGESRGLLSCRDSVRTIVSGGNRIQLGMRRDFIVDSG